MFDDVVKVFANDLTLPPMDPDQPAGTRFRALVRSVNNAPLRVRHHCYTHNQKCCLFGDKADVADLDISGLPCPDMSRAGLQQFQDGKTSIVFAAHAKMHAQKGTKLLIIENVRDTLMQYVRVAENNRCSRCARLFVLKTCVCCFCVCSRNFAWT